MSFKQLICGAMEITCANVPTGIRRRQMPIPNVLRNLDKPGQGKPIAGCSQHLRLLAGILLCLLFLAGCDARLPERVAWPDWLPRIPWIQAPETNSERDSTHLELMFGPVTEEQNGWLQEMASQFQAGHPDIRVVLTVAPDYPAALRRRLAEDSLPDVFLLDGGLYPELQSYNALAPLDGHLDDSADFHPLLRDAFTHDGSLYCAPRDVATLALIYDPARLAAAGLASPGDWAAFRTAAQRLADPGNSLYSLALAPDFSRWLPFLYQAGGRVVEPATQAVAIESSPAATALDFYANLVLDGHAFQLAELNSGWAGEAFGKGQVAMAIEGNWIVSYLADQFPSRVYAIAPLPAGPAGRGTVAFANCYAVAASSHLPEQAGRFANALTTPAALQGWAAVDATIPARTSLHPDWLASRPYMAPYLEALAYAHVWQFPAGFDEVVRSMNRGIQQIFDGDAEAAGVLREVQERGNAVLGR